MKRRKALRSIIIAASLMALVAGVYSLILSLKGEGQWSLTIALGLIAFSNFGSMIVNQKLNKED